MSDTPDADPSVPTTSGRITSRDRARSGDGGDPSASAAEPTIPDSAPLRLVTKGERRRAERQRTRVLLAVDLPEEAPQPESACDTTMLYAALGDLPADELQRARETLRSEPERAKQFEALSRHLELHSALPRIRPNAGSFLRLTTRMRNEGYLAYAYPGNHRLWRRALYAGIGALLILVALAFWRTQTSGTNSAPPTRAAAILSLLTPDGRASPETQPLNAGESHSLGADDAWLWLPSEQRGVFTKVLLARGTSFTVRSTSELHVALGEVLAVEVSPDALHKQPFALTTPQVRILARSAEFAAEVRAEETAVSVLRGSVQCHRDVDRVVRVVPSGYSQRARVGLAMDAPQPFLSLNVEPRAGADRQLLVTVTNRSLYRLQIDKAGGPAELPYRCRISLDNQGDEGIDFTRDLELWPVVGETGRPGVGYDDHLGTRLLDRTQTGDFRYQFVADLGADLAGMPRTDYTVAVRYVGRVYALDGMGSARARQVSAASSRAEVPVAAISPALRLDLKPTRLEERQTR